MPSFRRRGPVPDAEHVEAQAKKPEDTAQVLALAEEAEAEAAEAEAIAAAARARARALRLRREAEQAGTETTGTDTEEPSAATGAEPESASDIDSDETDADVAVEAPEEQPDVSALRRRGRARILKIAAISLAVLCTGALLAASGYMVWQHRQAVDQQRLNAEYTAAGRQSVVTLMSLDFNQAEEDVQRIIENSTGQFRTDFESQAEDFVQVAQDSKVVTDVTVNSVAVESMDEDSAVVLVAATSRVTNAAGAQQEPRAWRLLVDLQRDGEQIKMSKVEFVP